MDVTLAVTSLSYIRLFGVFTCRRKCDGTFDTLFLKLAGQLMRLLYIALIDKAVGVTAAGAVESCPAVSAVFLAVDMYTCKVILYLLIDFV